MTNQCTEQRFLEDVSKHQMTILRDDGVSRHIRFKQQDSINMSFDLITWPGYLCYCGDMGTYVFRRLHDMFVFFRTDREHMRLKDGLTLAINPGYWGEKLEAVDRSDGYREWNKDKFEARLREDFSEFLVGCDPDEVEELKERFEDEIIAILDDGGKENAYQTAQQFPVNGKYPFQDWWEVDTDEYVYRFIWCCYALAWAVQQYDSAKSGSEVAA